MGWFYVEGWRRDSRPGGLTFDLVLARRAAEFIRSLKPRAGVMG